jgi:hypothetical protein
MLYISPSILGVEIATKKWWQLLAWPSLWKRRKGSSVKESTAKTKKKTATDMRGF